MTFGIASSLQCSPEHKLARIQEKGQVTLPKETREKLGLRKGDLVAITETKEGLLIVPAAVVAIRALDRIGEALQGQGLSLEDLIESGREEREEEVA